MNALSKAIMAESLCNELGISKPDAKVLVDLFFEVIRPQRPGRNPKTGEDIPVLARRVVTFKPGLKLKLKVESYEV